MKEGDILTKPKNILKVFISVVNSSKEAGIEHCCPTEM
jgi:hypothetical protein